MTRLLIEGLSGESTVIIKGDELHYLTRVRRHRKGDTVELHDKSGNRYVSSIVSIESDQALLEVQKQLAPLKDCLPVHLVMAVPKRNLMDDVVRKASELGVESIIPVIADRSVVKPGTSKLERWRTIAKESRRQCGRKTELSVEDVMPLAEALSNFPGTGTKIIMDTQSPKGPSIWAKGPLDPPVCAVIGPEGGFSKNEIDTAKDLGFVEATLGNTILRVETAAIATAVLCLAKLGWYD